MRARTVSIDQEEQVNGDMMLRVLKVCRCGNYPVVDRVHFFSLLDDLHSLVKNTFYEGDCQVESLEVYASCEAAFHEAQRGNTMALYDAVLETVVQYDKALKELCQ